MLSSTLLPQALMDDQTTAIIYADASGGIAFWNKGAEALFGHNAAQLAEKRVDIIVPAAYRDAHWVGFHRTIGTQWRGSDGWSPIEALHRDGHLLALEVFLTPLIGQSAGVSGVLALFRTAKPAK